MYYGETECAHASLDNWEFKSNCYCTLSYNIPDKHWKELYTVMNALLILCAYMHHFGIDKNSNGLSMINLTATTFAWKSMA